MSSSYESSRSRRRGAWGNWVPLILTVAVASAGVAAWVWNQRLRDDEEDESVHSQLAYESGDYCENPAYSATGSRYLGTSVNPEASRAGSVTYGVTDDARAETSSNAGSGWGVPGALRRSPSPQQFFSHAGKTLAAGAGAVGAAMGSALAAIREEDKNAYADHETWSEEAEARKTTKPSPSPSPSPTPSPPPSQVSNRRRKTVAVVVSADSGADDFSDDGFHEHASILSHIPRNIDFSAIKLFVLVYSPGLKESALEAQIAGGGAGAASLSSSFSNIDPENAHTPGSEKSPQLKSTADSAFTALYSQALGLVEKETMVMPFTSPNGHVHILRHLQPEVVYLQESLAGDNGNYVMQLQTWLRHDVILIVGADGSGGGLADSDSEGPEKPGEKEDVWWEREERVGRGRGVVVVDSLMVSDDWERRVLGKE